SIFCLLILVQLILVHSYPCRLLADTVAVGLQQQMITTLQHLDEPFLSKKNIVQNITSRTSTACQGILTGVAFDDIGANLERCVEDRLCKGRVSCQVILYLTLCVTTLRILILWVTHQ